ncbi:hypothetical protein ARMGADRAFT_1040116 [Armillaria gallica]|uniref:DUF6535 domain-containing protein n=1 Tax=Armillaria gallica TaxID=47427 RepID=A0A2H3CYL6_ARMGA|nr:hypothetical protein ARMGADRAFT_1040116 [Armillaria gallica]
MSGNHQWGCTRMDGILGAAMVRSERIVHKGNRSELEVGLKFDKEEPVQWNRAEIEKEDKTKQADNLLLDLEVPIWASAATLEVSKSVSTVSEGIIVALRRARTDDNADERIGNVSKRIHAPRKRRILLALLFLTSLALNVSTAFLVILVDQWYWNYLSPAAGDPQVRALTHHFRYKGLLKWHVSRAMNILQSCLHFSIFIFVMGIGFSVLISLGIVGTIPLCAFLLTMLYYILTSFHPLRYPDCPYKTPLTFCFPSRLWESALSVTTLPETPLPSAVEDPSKVQASKTQSAEQSRIENEADALHWLYVISSTTTIRRLVIQALAGLSPDYIARVEEVFRPHWAEIRDEKERMLMDCMVLTREKPPRWIPREISNIDGRIEPLFRLEILFPALRREFPSRLFQAHDLDFLTEDISEALSITLPCIDDAHIQKPTDQMQFVRNALAKIRKGLFDDPENFLTDEMRHILITNIYSPSNNPSVSSTCTLAHAAVEYFKPQLLQSLLSFFKEGHVGPDFDKEELEQWHRAEREKEEGRELVQRATRLGPTMLSKGMPNLKRQAVSEIDAEPGDLRTADPSEECLPEAKRSRLRLREDHWTILGDLARITVFKPRTQVIASKTQMNANSHRSLAKFSWPFKEPRLDRDDLDATVFLPTISYLKLQAAKLTLANNSTSSKDVQPRAAKNKKANYPTDTSLKTRRTEVFKDILSYIASPLFIESSSFSEKNSEFKILFWTCRAHALVCMASFIDIGPEYCDVAPPKKWATKSFCSNILKDILDESASDDDTSYSSYQSAVAVCPDIRARFNSLKGAVGFLLGHAFSNVAIGAYEAFREKGGFGDIALKDSLHPELIEALRSYITCLSEVAEKFPNNPSDCLIHWHIKDLHQVHVIGFICAAITYSDTLRRHILSSLVSIDPSYSEWDGIVKILTERNGEYLFKKYILGQDEPPEDQKYLNKSMKETVRILAECLHAEMDRKNGKNWLSKIFNYCTGSHKRVHDPEGGIELGRRG